MRRSLSHSRRGFSTIIAEVMMVLIVIIMSAIVFVWVGPTFQSNTGQDNSGAAYAEKFSTLWGNFATFAVPIPESLRSCSDTQYYGMAGCTPASGTYITCPPSPITTATSQAVLVSSNSVCVIQANVGGVYVQSGSNVTVIGATINGLLAVDAARITLKNVNNAGFTMFLNVAVINISGSTFYGNPNWCEGPGGVGAPCDMSIFEGGPGIFTMTNSTVNGELESEVGHQTFITSSTIVGRLEVESADFGQILNNKIGVLDLDQNGIIVISGNTIYGNDPYFDQGTGILYGLNRWCGSGNNVVSGSTNGACIGNIEIDITNTGSIPVNLVAAYMSNAAVPGPNLSWKLLSGGPSHNSFPITIPVGQSANVTLQWTPPPQLTTLPWNGLYFIFVSSHNNFVDGYLYFGHNPALTITSQSRPQNRICPPCY